MSRTVIKHEAKAHAIRMNIHDFKGSYCWVANFMKLVTQHKDNHSLEHIGNMDEVPVYFDMPSKFTLYFQGLSDIHITTTGSEHSRFTVVLCVTASRIKLPAYVIFRRKTIPKFNHPSNIIV